PGSTAESGHNPDAGSVAGPPAWRIKPGHGLWLVRQLADQTSLYPRISGSAAKISFALGRSGSVEPFTLTERSSDGSLILAVVGLLDLSSPEQLCDAVERLLAGDPVARLVIDLAGLTFWDAFGLAGLLRAQGRVAASAGASLTLADIPDQLAMQLKETGLTDSFTSAGDPDVAGGLPAGTGDHRSSRSGRRRRVLADHGEHGGDGSAHGFSMFGAEGALATPPGRPHLVAQFLRHHVPVRAAHEARRIDLTAAPFDRAPVDPGP